MRLGVLGNCQCYGYSDCFSTMFPDAEILSFGLMQDVVRDRPGEVAEALAGCDVVFSQPVTAESFGPLRTELLQSAVPKLQTLPAIAFTGFHPDAIWIAGAQGVLPAPFWNLQLHSSIGVAGFLSGLNPEETEDLFNSFVFASLGWLDEFPAARAAFLRYCAGLGFEVEALFDRWLASGSFMYTINHPRIDVLFDLARIAVTKAGLDAPGAGAELPADMLGRHAHWPVYPELAEEIGVPGSTRFWVSDGEAYAHVDRLQVLERYFELYRATDRGRLTSPAVSRVLDIIS